MNRYWIGVASAEHVRKGRMEGFMQLCHGKKGPLQRIQPGDGIVYYSPTEMFRGADRCQMFTALGTICDRPAYAFDMGGGFVPFRRDVAWRAAFEVPIQPLLPLLELTAGKSNWGYPFRFGIVEITEADFHLIEQMMCGPAIPASRGASHQSAAHHGRGQ